MSGIIDNNGLIMYWAFDEGTGANAMESISQVKDDIQYVFNQAEFTEPCSPQWRRGVTGSGLLFDGYSTYIAHPANQEDPNAEPESLSALSIGYGLLRAPAVPRGSRLAEAVDKRKG